jgi:hypothetical protein
MYDVRIELRNLAETAKALHLKERQISLESVALIGELERRNAAVNMNMTSERFAAYVELTPNQYWKRAQAARVIRFFPQALEMAKADETQVSHLALISSRITQANAELLLAGIKGKSKREVEGLLSRVASDGRLLDKEPEVELRVKLTKSQLEVLDRAREVLSHGGHVPSLPEIMVKALGDLLDRRDPLRKAERAAARKEKADAASPGKEVTQVMDVVGDIPSPGKGSDDVESDQAGRASPGKEARTYRPTVPAAIRHAVWLRDGGRCTWQRPDGSRCNERSMLELDHIKMWCRGGEHELDNLTLRCRRHNQFAADQELGAEFMSGARSSNRNVYPVRTAFPPASF